MAIVTVAAVFTLVAPRPAGYLAAVSLLGFGFWEAWVTTHLHLNTILSGSRYWYDFLLGASNRPVVGVSALASVAAGLLLARWTIAADVVARRNGLTAQVQRLTVTRAVAVDSAAAELRRPGSPAAARCWTPRSSASCSAGTSVMSPSPA